MNKESQSVDQQELPPSSGSDNEKVELSNQVDNTNIRFLESIYRKST